MSCNFPRDGAGDLCALPRAPAGHSAEGTRRAKRRPRLRNPRSRRAGPECAAAPANWTRGARGPGSGPYEPTCSFRAGPCRAYHSSIRIPVGAGVRQGIMVSSPGPGTRRGAAQGPGVPPRACALSAPWSPVLRLWSRSWRCGRGGRLGEGSLLSTLAPGFAADPGPRLSSRARSWPPCPGEDPRPRRPPHKGRAGRARGAARAPRCAQFAHPISGPRPCLQRPCVCRIDCIEL